MAARYPGKNDAFTIGIIGADSLAEELERIVGSRTVNSRPARVRRLRVDDRLAGVNMLFIGRSYYEHLNEILQATKGEPSRWRQKQRNWESLSSAHAFSLLPTKWKREPEMHPTARAVRRKQLAVVPITAGAGANFRSGGKTGEPAPYPTHLRELRNMRIHGESSPQASGCHEFCTVRKTRSACGISTVNLPSGVVTEVIPCGEPFGL
jgi:hypothetical protein